MVRTVIYYLLAVKKNPNININNINLYKDCLGHAMTDFDCIKDIIKASTYYNLLGKIYFITHTIYIIIGM